MQLNELWGPGRPPGAGWTRRRTIAAFVALFAVIVPFVALADTGQNGSSYETYGSFVAPALERAAAADPAGRLAVIVQSSNGTAAAERALAAGSGQTAGFGQTKQLDLVGGVATTVPAARLDDLASTPGLTITPDTPVVLDGNPGATQGRTSNCKCDKPSRKYHGARPPAIAIVDSGIDASRPDFAGRVAAAVDLSSLQPNSPGDGFGHGTFVAGVAAGSAPGYSGAAPTAPIVSIDVMNDAGMARTSDVIRAAQWILANKDRYNIGVANFSLHAAGPSSFRYDPLDRAIEGLWFSGVVVVTAVGNYGLPNGPSGVPTAPGNDPFVLTVGALDGSPKDTPVLQEVAAPWSAYGYTYDGFAKPELAATGRYVVGPVPADSTLARQQPDKIVAPGYMQLSGTSFAAPLVSGAAATLMGVHPDWTPDQVKGALLVSARPLPKAAPLSVGVGALDADRAVAEKAPPSANLALDRFLVTLSGDSVPSFDGAAWVAAAKANPSWDALTWQAPAWNRSKALVSWSDVSWSDVSWSDVSWSDVSWSDVSWDDLAGNPALSDPPG
jgi:serine protease AprX